MTKIEEISWRRLPVTPATEEQIAKAEHSLGVRYPEDFRAMAPGIHGASPDPDEFYVTYPRHQRRVGCFIGVVLSFDPESSSYLMPIVEAHRREGILPRGVVPFGKDGGGDLMAFDFRADPVNPPVVYVAIASATDDEGDERHIVPLSASFTEFLAMLQRLDESDPHPEGR